MAVASGKAAPADAAVTVTPSLEEARALAQDHNLIPVRQTFIADCETPVSAFLKLRTERQPAFLLESAEQGRVGRYSFIGFRPRKVLRWSLGDPGDPYAVAADNCVASIPPRSRASRRSPAGRWACSPMTSCGPSSRWGSPTPIRSACPIWP